MLPRILDGLEAAARLNPHAIALVGPDGAQASYAELTSLVTGGAARLRALGIGSADRVAIVVPDGPEALTAFLAVSEAAVAAPINPAFPQSEYETYLAHIRATALVTSFPPASPAVGAAVALGLPVVQLIAGTGGPAGQFTLEALSAARPSVPTDASLTPSASGDVALVLTTSGTTSRPKVVPLTHAGIAQSARNIADSLALTTRDRCFDVMPLFHVHGLIGGALSSLAAGASVICPRGFDAPRFFSAVDALEPTWYTAAPTMHQAIASRVDNHRDVLDRRRLRLIRSCSAALPGETRDALERAFGAPVVEAYGMTEACHQIASTPLPVARDKAGSVGVACGTRIAIRDPESGQLLATGETGEIVLQGSSITAGYESAPEANAQTFVDGWFRTGDQGRLDDEGYLFINGRLKEIINRGGEKISPPEVDQALLAHPAVAQACAFALPDPRLGETVAAAVVLKPGAACSERDLRVFVAGRLAAFKVPDRVVFVEALPRTPTGKVQRLGMAGRLGLQASGSAPVQPPPVARAAAETSSRTTFLRRIVTAIWCDVLGLEDVADDQSFFDLGGDSILAAQVLSRVRDMLHVELSVVVLFEEPTIAGLARAIEHAGSAPAAPPVRRRSDGHAALSSAQQRLWFLNQWSPGDATYHDYAAWRVRGPLDTRALEASLEAVVRRHEILRTAFRDVNGQPIAIVEPHAAVVPKHHDVSNVVSGQRDGAIHRLVLEEIERPFDVTRAPLVRCLTIRLGETDHVVVVTLHHLVCDGWSMAVLQRELGAAYTAHAASRPADLPALPAQFADHAAAEADWLQSADFAAHLAHWQDYLAPPRSTLELSTDRPRGRGRTPRPNRRSRIVSQALVDRLHTFVRGEQATMFMVLASGFGAMLARFARQEQIAIGTPVAGRASAGAEGLIGPFANTIVLRVDVSGNPTFRELVARVRRDAIAAYAHQTVPFERVVDTLGVDRDPDRPPVFQAFLNYRNLPPRPSPFPTLDVDEYPIDVPGLIGDVALDIIDRGGTGSGASLVCRLDYDAGLLEETTVDAMLDQFERLLDDGAAHSDRRLDDLATIGDAERQRVLTAWNDTATTFDIRCVHELVEAQVARTPDAVALRCAGASISYRDLNGRANQLARRLAARGVAAGDRVGIAVAPSIDLVVSLLATIKAGAAYVPLDPLQPAARLAAIHADTAPAVVITLDQSDSWPEVLCLDQERGAIAEEADADLGRACSASDLFCIIPTSGSTGMPKGVMLPHAAVANRLEWARRARPLTADDRALLSSSIAFDVSIAETFEALVAGASVVVAPAGVTDLSALVDTVLAEGVSVLSAVPSILELLLADFRFAQCASLQRIISIGEALTAHVARGILSTLDVTLSNEYGPAEATVHVAGWHMTRSSLADMGDRAVPIGRPIANVRLYVLDANMRPVPIGVPGELYIGGACLALGYWQRPDLTAKAFVADPFFTSGSARLYRTGDLVRYRSDGALLFLGRLDAQVKIRGVRVEPGEIETALRAHPSIRDAAVVAHGTPPRLVAYVVAVPTVTAGDLRRHLATRLPAAMIPGVFVPLDALLRTAGGKLNRRALPAPAEDVGRANAAMAPPETPLQQALVAIWQELLQTPCGIDDDFFALGGHSLLAMQVIARIRAVLGCGLPVRAIFEAPTIAALATSVARALALESSGTSGARLEAVSPDPAPVDRPSPLPMSFAQRQLWFLDRLETSGSSYHVDLGWRLQGALNVQALTNALSAVVARHEILRTVFPSHAGVPEQIVTQAGPMDLREIDLRDAPLDAQLSALERIAHEEARRPFDLATGPLLRATLVRLDASDHALILALHHIICDGWSIDVICRELSELYAAGVAGRPAALPPVRLQYADYAIWQRQQLESGAWDGDRSYWSDRLTGAPTLELSGDRPRPATRTTRGGRVVRTVAADRARAILNIGRTHGVTLHMTLLAAFSVLLARQTGSTDIVIGSPVAGRSRLALEGLVGFLANVLALRVSLAGDPTVAELLGRVRDVTLEAYAHAELPFEALVEGLRLPRDPSRTPVFQTMLVLQDSGSSELMLPGVRSNLLPIQEGTSKFDLLVAAHESDDGLRLDVEYNADLFDRTTIDRLADRFGTILDAFTTWAATPISELPLMSDAERQLVVSTWNDTAQDYPRDATIHELFAVKTSKRPDDVVVIQGDRRLTRQQIDAEANVLARRLQTAGVGPGDAVGLCCARSPRMVVALLAILKAGAAYLPISPRDPVERQVFILRDAGARVVVTEPGFVQAVRDTASEIAAVDLCDAGAETDGTVVATAVSSDATAYIMYTSGSTGRPKGVVVPHRAVIRLVYGLDRVAGHPLGRFLQFSPLAFDASTFDLWMPLLRGDCCVLFEGDDVPAIDAIARAIQRHDIECLWLTAALFNTIVDTRPDALAGVRDLFIGGETLSPGHVARAQRALPAVRLINGYGPTEATTFTCCHVIDRPCDEAAPIPIGRPLGNTRVLILDDHGQVLPIGVAGELHVGGDGLARGYYGQSELTAQKFIAHPLAGPPDGLLYKTGDRARWRADGTIEFLGREDRQIKLRGFRIELEEIEAQLRRYPGVAQAVVDVRRGGATDVLEAFVAPSHHARLEASDLRSFLGARLPDYMVPARVAILGKLPLTPNGKIDRASLPDLPESPADDGRPRRAIEQTLATIWAETLGAAPRSVHENFFEAGGHSLLAASILARVQTAFGLTLPISMLFHAPTIALLARAVEEAAPIGRRVLVPLQPSGGGPAIVFVHPHGGEVWRYVPLAWRLAPEFASFGLQLPDYDPRGPYPTLEALATIYVDALQREVPGPYVIAGYSSGAAIAFEIAQQLLARGAAVDLVVALDGGLPNRGPAPRGWRLIARGAANLLQWIQYDLLVTPAAQTAGRVWDKLSNVANGAPSFKILDERGVPVPRAPNYSRHHAAVLAYRPRVYNGDVMVVKARARPLLGPFEADLGWRRMVSGPISVVVVPGSHETFLREPYVQRVAEEMRRLLKK